MLVNRPDIKKMKSKVYVRKGDFESLLDLLQDLLVFFAADERNRKTLGAETTRTTDSVQVRVCIPGQIVVDGKIDTLDIDTTTENIGGNADTLVELFEFFVAFDTM